MTKTPTLGEAGMAWLQGLVEREGLVRGSWNAMRSLWELSFDYLPSRKRMRYGDIDYDFDHGVNTTWAAPSLAVRLREVFTRGRYQPSEPGRFHEILEALVIDYERFVFLDLGSGKGRTLLMASDYPFRRVIGVEVIPELHAIAEENVRRYRNGAQKCSAIETWVGDAREFPFPQDPTVVYLFNPFPGDVLRKVLERLKESLDASPRDCWVIYHNLVHEEVFREMKWLRQELGNDQYAIHRVQMSG